MKRAPHHRLPGPWSAPGLRPGVALLVALACGPSPSSAQGVEYHVLGTQLTGLTVDGATYAPSDLRTGNSLGAVQFIGAGGQHIVAADSFDLGHYFARLSIHPEWWRIDLGGAWSDASGPSPDFFVFEYGGNDELRAVARFAGGGFGQEVVLGPWQPLPLTALGGPNDGQQLHVLAFSGTDLLDAAGQAVDSGDLLDLVELRSPTVDGALFTWRPTVLPPTVPLARPIPGGSHGSVPLGDGGQTVIELTSGLTGPADQYTYAWSIPGATYVQGTGPHSPTVRFHLPGATPVRAELLATPLAQPAQFGKGAFEIGLELPGGARLVGTPRVWQRTELWFRGPLTDALSNAPNPFLDRRLDVTFTRPDGSQLAVPGFYDGDGRGVPAGDVWKVRLCPDQPGQWSFQASFRAGAAVAVSANPQAGSPTSFDGTAGHFTVGPRDPQAPGFLAAGRLDYVGRPYLRQVDGGYWLKCGTNSPENLLGFRGFSGTADQNFLDGLHEFAPHLGLWTPSDPDLPRGTWAGDRALIGALEYLRLQGVNSIYFLPLNLGGDGWDTAPFVGFDNDSFQKTHYALERLLQWETVLWAATERGIHLHLVLSETEVANEQWLDSGAFGTERKLFLREMVARCAHHLGLTWNLAEENDFSVAELVAMAGWIRGLDPYDHPITFHVRPDDVADYLPLYGHPHFEAASVQYTPDLGGSLAEEVRAKSAAAARPWIVGMDENTPATVGLWSGNTADLRRRVLYDVYFSGGQIEWYLGQHPLPVGGDTNLEDFATRQEMWGYTRHARHLLQSLPFWWMEPRDPLLSGEFVGEYGQAEVFARENEVYAVYLPDARSGGILDLTAAPGTFLRTWYDPRTGQYTGATSFVTGGGALALGLPPHSVTQDWVCLLRRPTLWSEQATVSVASGSTVALELDGGVAARGLSYWLLGSLSGTSPGLPLGNGFTLPLKPDAYLWAAVLGEAPLTPAFGLLDEAGRATVQLQIPAVSSLAGLGLHHAWIADPLFLKLPSDACSLWLVP
jgi:hypothetical protein